MSCPGIRQLKRVVVDISCSCKFTLHRPSNQAGMLRENQFQSYVSPESIMIQNWKLHRKRQDVKTWEDLESVFGIK